MAKDLEIPVDVRVTAGLHPQNVAALELYNDETLLVLGPVVTAFDEAYKAVASVHNARDAAAKDPTLTEAAQLMKVQDHADRMFKRAAGALDSSMAVLKRNISTLDSELSQPVEARASHSVSKEIRQHVKALPNGERMGFVRKYIEKGDSDTVSAILGGPSFLSGIDEDMQAILLRMWHEKNSPAVSKRLKAMQAARDLIIRNSGLLHSELEKAVGAPAHEVKALRAAKSKADKAFSF